MLKRGIKQQNYNSNRQRNQKNAFTEECIHNNLRELEVTETWVGTSAGVETSYKSSTERHQELSRETLFLNISHGIKILLNQVEENNKKRKRKIREWEQDENKIAYKAASSLLALVNTLNGTNNFKQLNDMHNHMSKITGQLSDLQAANKDKSVKINRDK
jgi:hypothetical protein